MKKLSFFIILLAFFSSFKSSTFAQNIQTSDSSVSTKVENKVNGSNCQTHIEVTVNGQKEIINSSDCGTNIINKSESGENIQITNTPSIIKDSVIKPTAIITPKVLIPTSVNKNILSQKAKKETSFILFFTKELQNLINKFFNIF